MFAREAKDTKIHLTDEQMLRQVESALQQAILEEVNDPVMLNEYKKMKARLRKKGLKQRINKEFTNEFMLWLTGRSKYNVEKGQINIVDPDTGMTVVRRDVTMTPWGNKPLANLPGVAEFLDQTMDRRAECAKIIASLKLRGPTDLTTAYLYFKYIVRREGIDSEDALVELSEFQDYDNPPEFVDPVHPDLGTAPGGPGKPNVPPFDLTAYTGSFNTVKGYADFSVPYAPAGGPGAPITWYELRNLPQYRSLRLEDQRYMRDLWITGAATAGAVSGTPATPTPAPTVPIPGAPGAPGSGSGTAPTTGTGTGVPPHVTAQIAALREAIAEQKWFRIDAKLRSLNWKDFTRDWTAFANDLRADYAHLISDADLGNLDTNLRGGQLAMALPAYIAAADTHQLLLDQLQILEAQPPATIIADFATTSAYISAEAKMLAQDTALKVRHQQIYDAAVAQNAIATLSTQSAAQQGQIATLQGDTFRLETILRTERANLAKAQADLAKVTADLQAATLANAADAQRLTREKQALEAQILQLNIDIGSNTTALTNAGTQITALTKQVADLQTDLTQAQADLAAATAAAGAAPAAPPATPPRPVIPTPGPFKRVYTPNLLNKHKPQSIGRIIDETELAEFEKAGYATSPTIGAPKPYHIKPAALYVHLNELSDTTQIEKLEQAAIEYNDQLVMQKQEDLTNLIYYGLVKGGFAPNYADFVPQALAILDEARPVDLEGETLGYWASTMQTGGNAYSGASLIDDMRSLLRGGPQYADNTADDMSKYRSWFTLAERLDSIHNGDPDHPAYKFKDFVHKLIDSHHDISGISPASFEEITDMMYTRTYNLMAGLYHGIPRDLFDVTKLSQDQLRRMCFRMANGIDRMTSLAPSSGTAVNPGIAPKLVFNDPNVASQSASEYNLSLEEYYKASFASNLDEGVLAAPFELAEALLAAPGFKDETGLQPLWQTGKQTLMNAANAAHEYTTQLKEHLNNVAAELPLSGAGKARQSALKTALSDWHAKRKIAANSAKYMLAAINGSLKSELSLEEILRDDDFVPETQANLATLIAGRYNMQPMPISPDPLLASISAVQDAADTTAAVETLVKPPGTATPVLPQPQGDGVALPVPIPVQPQPHSPTPINSPAAPKEPPAVPFPEEAPAQPEAAAPPPPPPPAKIEIKITDEASAVAHILATANESYDTARLLSFLRLGSDLLRNTDPANLSDKLLAELLTNSPLESEWKKYLDAANTPGSHIQKLREDIEYQTEVKLRSLARQFGYRSTILGYDIDDPNSVRTYSKALREKMEEARAILETRSAADPHDVELLKSNLDYEAYREFVSPFTQLSLMQRTEIRYNPDVDQQKKGKELVPLVQFLKPLDTKFIQDLTQPDPQDFELIPQELQTSILGNTPKKIRAIQDYTIYKRAMIQFLMNSPRNAEALQSNLGILREVTLAAYLAAAVPMMPNGFRTNKGLENAAGGNMLLQLVMNEFKPNQATGKDRVTKQVTREPAEVTQAREAVFWDMYQAMQEPGGNSHQELLRQVSLNTLGSFINAQLVRSQKGPVVAEDAFKSSLNVMVNYKTLPAIAQLLRHALLTSEKMNQNLQTAAQPVPNLIDPTWGQQDEGQPRIITGFESIRKAFDVTYKRKGGTLKESAKRLGRFYQTFGNFTGQPSVVSKTPFGFRPAGGPRLNPTAIKERLFSATSQLRPSSRPSQQKPFAISSTHRKDPLK